MSSYSADDIKVVKWDEYVRKKREMCFGENEVDGEEIAEALKYPAIVLGAKSTKITRIDTWYYFCSDIDWLFLSELEAESIHSVFDKPSPFPEGGSPNSYRTESLCLPFSTDAFTVSGDDTVLLKGELPEEEEFKRHLKNLGNWGRIVGYKFDANA